MVKQVASLDELSFSVALAALCDEAPAVIGKEDQVRSADGDETQNTTDKPAFNTFVLDQKTDAVEIEALPDNSTESNMSMGTARIRIYGKWSCLTSKG